jgi:ribonuclease PH
MTTRMRPDGRAPRELRPLSIETGAVEHAEGSCLITQGRTRVLVTATVEEKVPPFLRETGDGWVTAEYGMLPRATLERSPREAARGKQSGRTLEIQRLIGRALRGVVDRKRLGPRTVTLDCDVLVADAGTRCASVTGAYVALALATAGLEKRRLVEKSPLREAVAGISVGVVGGAPVLDLDYAEGQGTAEKEPFDDKALRGLLAVARGGLRALFVAQGNALSGALPPDWWKPLYGFLKGAGPRAKG